MKIKLAFIGMLGAVIVSLFIYKYNEERKYRKDVELLVEVIGCTNYTLGYIDGSSDREPIVGSLMNVDSEELSKAFQSNNANEVETAIIVAFVSVYKVGFNDGKNNSVNYANETLLNLIKDNPEKEIEIKEMYKDHLQKSLKTAEQIRLNRRNSTIKNDADLSVFLSSSSFIS